MSAVTIADFSTYKGGVTLTNARRASLQIVLDGLCGEIEAFLGKPVGVRNFEEDYDWDTWQDSLRLRNRPVTRIESVHVVEVGTSPEVVSPITSAYYTPTGWGLAGLQTVITAVWPYVLRVNYNAGLDLTKPKYEAIKLTILKGADRWYRLTEGGDSEDLSMGGAIQGFSTDGGYSVTYVGHDSQNARGSFLVSELNAIARFKRRT